MNRKDANCDKCKKQTTNLLNFNREGKEVSLCYPCYVQDTQKHIKKEGDTQWLEKPRILSHVNRT